jgi:hypothetical protein
MAREGQKPAPPDFCQVRDKTDPFAYAGRLGPAPGHDLGEGCNPLRGSRGRPGPELARSGSPRDAGLDVFAGLAEGT